MADIQSQTDVNGIPSKLESATEEPTDAAAVTNVPATAIDAQSPLTTMKQSDPIPPSLEVSSNAQPSAPMMEIIPESQTQIQTQDQPQVTSLTNGNSAVTNSLAEPHLNGHGATIEFAKAPEPEAVATTLPSEASFADSIVPSSIPSEIPSSTPVAEAMQPQVSPMLQPVISPPQAPTSDLRTVPHSDNLAPETVALIEERKHEEDNSADITSAPTKEEPSPMTVSAPAQPLAATGLPSPPTQSTPPPAPEMPHATLLDHKSEAPAAPEIPADVPMEQPIEPAPTPAVAEPILSDVVMEDAPPVSLGTESTSIEIAPPAKVAREREEDIEDAEPVAKRLKTDELPSVDQSEFKIPEPPSATSAAAIPDSVGSFKVEGDDAVTAPRLAAMKKVISNLKKSKSSTAFRVPVDYAALNIPTYPDVVRQPMDLGTIDAKLKKNEYTSVKDFVDDFELIVNNCVLFNGTEHQVTQTAFAMQKTFNHQMASLPAVSEVEPSKAEKKAMKLKTEPMRTAPPRRPSVTTPGAARSPKSAVTATTPSFAPGPDGIPLIRRDSNIVDGRPKRAIVPPKRNSDFSGVRPKKKKYELQLRFCQEVLKEIASTKHWQMNQYFTHPVDPVALNIPTYFNVIKKPMDLGTIQQKLDTNAYEKAKDFEEDVKLIFKNCYKFNPEGDYVNNLGRQLETLFDQKWATKDDWIAAREPQSEPQSEAEDDDDADGSDEEEADSEDDRNEKIKLLQAQIAAMSKQMGELTQSKKKKKISPPVDKKKGKSKPKKEKATAQFPGLSKTKDKKKSSSKKSEKERYVTFNEKQYISNGIAMLPEKQMQEALRIIQSSVPALANSNENEIELDIEEVPNHALLKLLSFVKKYAPLPPEEQDSKADAYSSAPTKSKKNKPMSKHEQEAQIEELKGRLGAYGGPGSPDAMQSVETGNDSSDDSADSEESEEE